MREKWERFEVYTKFNNPNFNNLVYFHAFAGSWKNKLHFFNSLNNINIYAFNMPGHGNVKANSIDEIDLHYYQKLATNFILDYQLDNLILMGHSMGGGITMGILNDNEINDKVKKIILEAPANLACFTNFDIIKKFIPKTIDDTWSTINELFYDPVSYFKTEANLEKFVSYEFNRLKRMSDLQRLIEYDNLKSYLQSIEQQYLQNKHETLMIMGGLDKIIPYEQTSRNILNLNNYKIAVIENTKHVPIIEQFGKCFNIIFDFIF